MGQQRRCFLVLLFIGICFEAWCSPNNRVIINNYFDPETGLLSTIDLTATNGSSQTVDVASLIDLPDFDGNTCFLDAYIMSTSFVPSSEDTMYLILTYNRSGETSATMALVVTISTEYLDTGTFTFNQSSIATIMYNGMRQRPPRLCLRYRPNTDFNLTHIRQPLCHTYVMIESDGNLEQCVRQSTF